MKKNKVLKEKLANLFIVLLSSKLTIIIFILALFLVGFSYSSLLSLEESIIYYPPPGGMLLLFYGSFMVVIVIFILFLLGMLGLLIRGRKK